MSKTVYGFCSAGCKYPVASKEDVPYKMIEISKEDYDALPDEEKNAPGVMYVVEEDLKIEHAVYADEAETAKTADEAKVANYVSGKEMIVAIADTVPITKPGLYVCTIVHYSSGNTIVAFYTAFISVMSLNIDSHTLVATYMNVNSNESVTPRCDLRYLAANRYLDLYSNSGASGYTYKFRDCRLLTEY